MKWDRNNLGIPLYLLLDFLPIDTLHETFRAKPKLKAHILLRISILIPDYRKFFNLLVYKLHFWHFRTEIWWDLIKSCQLHVPEYSWDDCGLYHSHIWNYEIFLMVVGYLWILEEELRNHLVMTSDGISIWNLKMERETGMYYIPSPKKCEVKNGN